MFFKFKIIIFIADKRGFTESIGIEETDSK